MLLYLDNSVLNRPLDEQKQGRVWFETISFILVLTLIESGECEWIWSPFNEIENQATPDGDRRSWITRCSKQAGVRKPIDGRDQIRANQLQQNGLKPLDALHVAYAERNAVDIFLTCDDRLIRRYSGKLKVMNPSTFIDNLRTL